MYQQKFTIKDIFNNQKLKGKIPLINYKETLQDNGKLSKRTKAKTINTLVFNTSVKASRSYYKPLKATRSGDTYIMGGTLVGDQDQAIDAVYNALLAKKMLMVWTANNGDLVRDALKESEKKKRVYGNNAKLYLKVGSMQEIENMTNKQLSKLMNNITNNIFYGDDFPDTQKKWGLENVKVGMFSYKQRKAKWKRKVGDE
jgi:hypothetical protein